MLKKFMNILKGRWGLVMISGLILAVISQYFTWPFLMVLIGGFVIRRHVMEQLSQIKIDSQVLQASSDIPTPTKATVPVTHEVTAQCKQRENTVL